VINLIMNFCLPVLFIDNDAH